jgi:acyl-CoA reductase-like NAD-dependent aldehyde dehydrogenase
MDRRRRRRGAGATFSPLVSPIDETLASHFVESDAAIIDAAVKHSHAAYVKHQDETIAKRVEWLTAAADATDKIEAELIRSLIRVIGKPKRAATFEAKRAGAFIRACAAQLPHLNGEVLPLDANAAGAGRFGFTTRVPYGVVAAITPSTARSISWCRSSRPRSPWAMRSWSSPRRPERRWRCCWPRR